jgi:hypothetical protein
MGEVKMRLHLDKTEMMSSVTKKVIDNFNLMSDNEFMATYQCSKLRYYKRVIKYGDPYMKAPLARLGKFLGKLGFGR